MQRIGDQIGFQVSTTSDEVEEYHRDTLKARSTGDQFTIEYEQNIRTTYENKRTHSLKNQQAVRDQPSHISFDDEQ